MPFPVLMPIKIAIAMAKQHMRWNVVSVISPSTRARRGGELLQGALASLPDCVANRLETSMP
jgi:hypothetical protein